MLETDKIYRWITTSNAPLYVGIIDINRDPNTSHASMARRINLCGIIRGGFLTINNDDKYVFAGGSCTVNAGNSQTLENALNRGIEYIQ